MSSDPVATYKAKPPNSEVVIERKRWTFPVPADGVLFVQRNKWRVRVVGDDSSRVVGEMRDRGSADGVAHRYRP